MRKYKLNNSAGFDDMREVSFKGFDVKEKQERIKEIIKTNQKTADILMGLALIAILLLMMIIGSATDSFFKQF